MTRDLNWNDIRLFLAAYRTGNLRAAAQTVALDQSTLSRRLDALETSMKTTLFMRSNRGIVPTDAAQNLRGYAERVESAIVEIERSVCGYDGNLDGTIRIMCGDGFGPFWLTPRLQAFHELHPTINIDLACFEQTNHGMSKAHLIFQLGRPSQEDLIGRKMGDIEFCLFASENYLARFRQPETSDELVNGLHKFVVSPDITSVTQNDPASQKAWEPWLAICSRSTAVSFATNSYAAQIKATLAGFGISLLPNYFEEQWPGLVRIEPENWTAPTVPITMLYHESVKQSKRVHLLIDFLMKKTRV